MELLNYIFYFYKLNIQNIKCILVFFLFYRLKNLNLQYKYIIFLNVKYAIIILQKKVDMMKIARKITLVNKKEYISLDNLKIEEYNHLIRKK